MNRLTAFHESGHACIAHVLNLSVEDIDANKGHMRGFDIEKELLARAAVYRTDPAFVRRWLLTLAGGSVAASIAGGGVRSDSFDWEQWGGVADKYGAERLIRAAGLDVSLDDLADEAFDFLKQRDIWDCVERVVRELRHFDGELDHELFVGAFEGYAS
jgi:hypothetical protein